MNIINKKIVLPIILVLMLGFVIALNFDNLIFSNLVSSGSSGSASIVSVRSVNSGLDNVRINIDVEDLDLYNGEVYEVWLVDLDSGYKLSLGSFISNSNGHNTFSFRQKINGFRVYDKLVITKEKLDDLDPTPRETILSLVIPGSDRHIFFFNSNLSGLNEVPGTNSSAFGFGDFIINTNNNLLVYNISISNLNGIEYGAHIHNFSLVGNNSKIIHNLPLGNQKIGIWNLSDADEMEIMNNMAYVNIHSDIFPNGEIMGQIIQVD